MEHQIAVRKEQGTGHIANLATQKPCGSKEYDAALNTAREILSAEGPKQAIKGK